MSIDERAIKERDALLSQNFTTLGESQRAFNGLTQKILDIAKPEPLKVTLVQAGEPPPARVGYKLVQILVFTNRVAPAKGLFQCDIDMGEVRAFVAGNSNLYMGPNGNAGGARVVDARTVQVDVLAPMMTATNPLVMSFLRKETDQAYECHYQVD
jgi:hypothetical protein